MSQMRTDPLAEATEVDMSDAVPVAVEGLALLCTLRGDKPVLHVARDERVGADLAEFLATMLPGRRILFFPPWDCLPFDGASPTPDAMGRRMAVLQALRDPRPGDVLIAPLSAFLQRLPPKDAVRCFEINQGQTLDIAALEDFLRDAGYVADDRVDEPGEFIFRGGTVEIYSGGNTYPCRIEFDEGTVAALRHFDPVSQRSLAETDRLQIVPVTELPASDAEWKRGSEHRLPECWDSLTALSDHMPDARITAMPATLAAAKRRHARLEEAWREAKADGAFPPVL